MAIDPVSLLGAAGSFLGLFKKSPSAYKQTRQGILGQAAGAREAAAQYGFNPLTLLGVSSPIGAGSGPMMGSSISDAFSLLADSLANRPGVGEKEALTRENADLRDQLRKQTLQPEVPGIYPRMQQGMGGGNANGAQAGVGVLPVLHDTRGADGLPRRDSGDGQRLRPLPQTAGLDPRREVEHRPASTSSGFMTVDNPAVPFPIYVPSLDGDEPLHWYEYPSLIAPTIGSGLYELYRQERTERESQPPVPRARRRAFGFTPNAFFPH